MFHNRQEITEKNWIRSTMLWRELTRKMDSGGGLEQNADAEKAEEKEELSNV